MHLFPGTVPDQHGLTGHTNPGQPNLNPDLFTSNVEPNLRPNIIDLPPIADQQLDWATFFNSTEADTNAGASDWMDFDSLVLGMSTFPV
jgi:hypothetical protein